MHILRNQKVKYRVRSHISRRGIRFCAKSCVIVAPHRVYVRTNFAFKDLAAKYILVAFSRPCKQGQPAESAVDVVTYYCFNTALLKSTTMADSRRTSLAIMPGKEGKSIDKNSYSNRKIGVLTSGGDAQGNVNIAGLPLGSAPAGYQRNYGWGPRYHTALPVGVNELSLYFFRPIVLLILWALILLSIIHRVYL